MLSVESTILLVMPLSVIKMSVSGEYGMLRSLKFLLNSLLIAIDLKFSYSIPKTLLSSFFVNPRDLIVSESFKPVSSDPSRIQFLMKLHS